MRRNRHGIGLVIRVALVLYIAALVSGSCGAQVVKTVVSGTILDPNGVPYAGGTIDATLLPTGTTPTVAGIGQIPGYVQPVSIDRSGAFTLPLYCNTAGGGCTAISPSGTQWLLTVRNPGAQPPVGYGGVSFTVTVTITGATQDLSSTLSAAAPQLLVSAAAGSGCTATGLTGDAQFKSSTGGCTNAAGIVAGATFNITSPDGNVTITAPGHIDFNGNGSGTSLNFSANANIGLSAGGDITLAPSGSVNETPTVSWTEVVNGVVGLEDFGAGVTVGSPTGGAMGAGTLNVGAGVFVNGQAPVQLANSVNVTPVTANANTTGFQNLQQATYSNPGAANSVGKTYRVHAGGTFAVATGGGAVKAQIALNMNTVQALNLSAFAPATTGTYSWSVDFVCTTKLSGALGRLLCAGHENFGGVAAGSQLDNATYPFFATINTDLTTDTGPLLQAQFSTGSTSNTMTSDYMSLEFLN